MWTTTGRGAGTQRPLSTSVRQPPSGEGGRCELEVRGTTPPSTSTEQPIAGEGGRCEHVVWVTCHCISEITPTHISIPYLRHEDLQHEHVARDLLSHKLYRRWCWRGATDERCRAATRCHLDVFYAIICSDGGAAAAADCRRGQAGLRSHPGAGGC